MEIQIKNMTIKLVVPEKSKVLVFPLSNGKIEVTVLEKEGE